MRKSLFQYLFLAMIVFVSFILIIPNQKVEASGTSEKLANTYLNAVSKYLYLGVSGKDTFDFNINSDPTIKGATFSWYVKTGKGNSNVVTIDKKTGVVTAQSIGTAYIRCKITLPDHTVLRPEATVIVRNNITGVEITNSPTNSTMTVGSTIDLNANISDTAAGKDKKTSGIVRFELKDDTAKSGLPTDDGIVTPTCSGSFSIRAVCFESIEDYQLWLGNKEDHASCVTATSSWLTIKVLSTKGTATTQKELSAMLASDDITEITISTKGNILNISEGNYTSKTLIISSSNTIIENHALFKQILMKSSSKTTWKEFATGNGFILYDSEILFHIAKQSQVEYVKLDTNSSIPVNGKAYNLLTMNVGGNLDKLDVMAASDIAISGTGNQCYVNIEGSGKTKITTSLKLYITSYTDLTIDLLNGSEGLFINTYGNVITNIENFSSTTLGININDDSRDLSSGYFLLLTGTDTAISVSPLNPTTLVKQTPVVFTAVTASPVKAGDTLLSSTLYGTFYNNSTEVIGTFTWSEPATFVNSSGYYYWTFTPSDSIHYNIVTGSAYVAVTK